MLKESSLIIKLKLFMNKIAFEKQMGLQAKKPKNIYAKRQKMV